MSFISGFVSYLYGASEREAEEAPTKVDYDSSVDIDSEDEQCKYTSCGAARHRSGSSDWCLVAEDLKKSEDEQDFSDLEETYRKAMSDAENLDLVEDSEVEEVQYAMDESMEVCNLCIIRPELSTPQCSNQGNLNCLEGGSVGLSGRHDVCTPLGDTSSDVEILSESGCADSSLCSNITEDDTNFFLKSQLSYPLKFQSIFRSCNSDENSDSLETKSFWAEKETACQGNLRSILPIRVSVNSLRRKNISKNRRSLAKAIKTEKDVNESMKKYFPDNLLCNWISQLSLSELQALLEVEKLYLKACKEKKTLWSDSDQELPCRSIAQYVPDNLTFDWLSNLDLKEIKALREIENLFSLLKCKEICDGCVKFCGAKSNASDEEKIKMCSNVAASVHSLPNSISLDWRGFLSLNELKILKELESLATPTTPEIPKTYLPDSLSFNWISNCDYSSIRLLSQLGNQVLRTSEIQSQSKSEKLNNSLNLGEREFSKEHVVFDNCSNRTSAKLPENTAIVTENGCGNWNIKGRNIFVPIECKTKEITTDVIESRTAFPHHNSSLSSFTDCGGVISVCAENSESMANDCYADKSNSYLQDSNVLSYELKDSCLSSLNLKECCSSPATLPSSSELFSTNSITDNIQSSVWTKSSFKSFNKDTFCFDVTPDWRGSLNFSELLALNELEILASNEYPVCAFWTPEDVNCSMESNRNKNNFLLESDLIKTVCLGSFSNPQTCSLEEVEKELSLAEDSGLGLHGVQKGDDITLHASTISRMKSVGKSKLKPKRKLGRIYKQNDESNFHIIRRSTQMIIDTEKTKSTFNESKVEKRMRNSLSYSDVVKRSMSDSARKISSVDNLPFASCTANRTSNISFVCNPCNTSMPDHATSSLNQCVAIVPYTDPELFLKNIYLSDKFISQIKLFEIFRKCAGAIYKNSYSLPKTVNTESWKSLPLVPYIPNNDELCPEEKSPRVLGSHDVTSVLKELTASGFDSKKFVSDIYVSKNPINIDMFISSNVSSCLPLTGYFTSLNKFFEPINSNLNVFPVRNYFENTGITKSPPTGVVRPSEIINYWSEKEITRPAFATLEKKVIEPPSVIVRKPRNYISKSIFSSSVLSDVIEVPKTDSSFNVSSKASQSSDAAIMAPVTLKKRSKICLNAKKVEADSQCITESKVGKTNHCFLQELPKKRKYKITRATEMYMSAGKEIYPKTSVRENHSRSQHIASKFSGRNNDRRCRQRS